MLLYSKKSGKKFLTETDIFGDMKKTIYSVQNKDDIKDFDELPVLQKKFNQLVQKLRKQDFPYDDKQLLEQITKTAYVTCKKTT